MALHFFGTGCDDMSCLKASDRSIKAQNPTSKLYTKHHARHVYYAAFQLTHKAWTAPSLAETTGAADLLDVLLDLPCHGLQQS